MKINDIADIINVTEKDPATSGIDIFVGLEHYDIAEPVIKRFGSTKMLSTAAKKFETGDVLIARRNVYLQRASVARFAGLTSGDSIVLRVKKDLDVKGTDYNNMCALIPFILNSINFWDYANTNADGTMSKRLSPAMLLDYEFSLPSLAEQKDLAEKLWAAYEVKQSYLKMIAATEEMVKAQFVEMFGTIYHPKGNQVLLGDVCDVKRGGSPRPIADYITEDENGLNWIKIGDADASMYITHTQEKIKPEGLSKTRMVHPGDLLLSNSMSFGRPYILKIEGCIHDGWLVLHFEHSKLSPMYLCFYLSQEATYKEMEKLAAGGVVHNLNAEIIRTLKITIPPIDNQMCFVNLKKQADKSISELRKSVETIDKVIKSLINENL